MKRIILDFNDCECYDDIHEIMSAAFGFDDDCGRNFDAVWDEMSTAFGAGDKVLVYVSNLSRMGEKGRIMKEYSKILHKMLLRLAEEFMWADVIFVS